MIAVASGARLQVRVDENGAGTTHTDATLGWLRTCVVDPCNLVVIVGRLRDELSLAMHALQLRQRLDDPN